ncbi:MAG: hypothetical protein ABMB14_33255 [Myxococcota bacterium]
MRFGWIGWLAAVGCSGDVVNDEPIDSGTPSTSNDCRSVACGSTSTTTAENAFTVNVHFAIDPDYAALMDAAERPATGPVWADVFRGADVSAIGPDADAVAIGAIHLDEVALAEDGSETASLVTLDLVGPHEIAVLGFLDSDHNADPAAAEPDDADPVTLPFDNAFTVEWNTTNDITVYFGLLNP